ncbi:MAG: hypothetical protein LUH02_03800, partial [Erysipelotrichaceae bacterium]|nr:hypothetical protein [Erysipelotrichaceae bacterium]
PYISYIVNQYKQFKAFIPKYEKYICSVNQVVLMNEDKDGVIKELKKDVSALTNAEISLLN